MSEKFKWGIIGPGTIAHAFATSFSAIDNAEIIAAGGRNMEKVNAFADQYGIKNRYNSFEEVVKDSQVDAVYIATPNTLHLDNIILAIDHGKAVLCEKPLALNYAQAQKAIAYAREKKVFLMEAVWSRFLPIYKTVREWLADGKIGDINLIQANFCFNVPWPEGDRHINAELGGGSLLDVGIYHLAMLKDVTGAYPSKTVSMPNIGKEGVDLAAAMIFGYDSGTLATVTTSVNTDTPQDLYIFGSKGYIFLENYWRATSAVLKVPGEEDVVAEASFLGNGYEYEVMEVRNQVLAGKTESGLMPLDESLAHAKAVNDIRNDWGMKFPGED